MDAVFQGHRRQRRSHVLKFLGKTEVNREDDHVSRLFHMTMESWHHAKEGARVRKHETSLVQTAARLQAF